MCFFFPPQASVSGQAEVLDALRPRDARHLHRHVLLRRTGQCADLLGPQTVYLNIHIKTHASLFP